jgi:hypothetical protein
MIQRTTVRLPQGLLDRAKRKAAAEGRTLTSLIEDGLRIVVSEKRGEQRTDRLLPRVSSATGGPAPGVNYRSLAALEELDDLEYAERMRNGFK